VAGTADDANNLSIIMTARELKPSLLTVARQNHASNQAVFAAAVIDMVMEPREIIANHIMGLLKTPLLMDFLKRLESCDETFCECLMQELTRCAGDAPIDCWSFRLLERVSQGAEADADTPAYTNRIHRDDCVGVLEFCLLRDLAGEPLPDILLGVDDDPASEWEVLSWLASQLKAPALRHQLGDGQRNKRCSNRLLKSLGYRFRYADFRSGYAAILAQR
jgi:hypothetical protein